MAKTFRRKTIGNSDDVYISKDKKHIVVHNVWSVPKKDKKGNVYSWTTYNRIRKYPNTKDNKKKAESVIGKIREK